MGENVLKFGTYVRVGNAAEAYELLQKNRNNKIVGGGIWMRLGSRRVATAIDLSACGLDQIEETETEFRIGAMCTLRQLERHTGSTRLSTMSLSLLSTTSWAFSCATPPRWAAAFTAALASRTCFPPSSRSIRTLS